MTDDELDRRLVAAACESGDLSYDPAWGLLRIEAHYNPIHTKIVSGHGHRYVASLSYALARCEAGRFERAERILLRCIADQDTDPASPTYGLWGYYAEEPVADMRPPDWNQADFNGRTLGAVLLRHRASLSAAVRDAALTAVGHAARSIVRRNVSMDYTNIAAKGTFVTLAAGQLLDDAELARYGRDRLGRFAANVEHTGSFVEYNSPAYWNIMAQALTAIGQYIDDDEVRRSAVRLMSLAWRHLASHWHASSGQLAGPMSRTYGDDITQNAALVLFVRKALAGAEPFGSFEPAEPDVELVWPAVLEPRVPPEYVAAFTRPATGDMYRELFAVGEAAHGASEQRGGAAVREIVGSTWRDATLALGTINQADTWLQRRNLLGQWVAPGDRPWRQPARYVRLRVLKDGFDFASGSFSSVQDGPAALWAVSFASPGGDRHLHLDMLAAGEPFDASSIQVSFEFGGAADAVVWLGERRLGDAGDFGSGEVVDVVTGGVEVAIQVSACAFGGSTPRGAIRRQGGLLFVDVDLFRTETPVSIDLGAVGPALAAGALAMGPAGSGTDRPGPLAAGLAARPVAMAEYGEDVELSGLGLRLRARATVGTRADHAAAFATGLP